MKIHGYCEDCKRIKRVQVNSAGMLRLARQQVAVGHCGCADEKKKNDRTDKRTT